MKYTELSKLQVQQLSSDDKIKEIRKAFEAFRHNNDLNDAEILKHYIHLKDIIQWIVEYNV